MFSLEYAGSTNQAVAAINAMKNSPSSSADNALLTAAQTLAIAAINANYLQGTQYTGNVYLKLRGGWQDGTMTIHMRLDNVAMTGQNEVSVGNPVTRAF